jgi:hypothetical protein
MKEASMADMVIMATQFAQITPIIGDIAGGTFDLGSAITGVNVEGAKLTAIERSIA